MNRKQNKLDCKLGHRQMGVFQLKKLCAVILLAFGLILLTGDLTFANTPVDEFEYVNAEESMARLDNYLIALQNDPAAAGYVLIYGPKISKRGEVEAHIKQMRHYISGFRKFDAGRITFMKGGYRDRERVTIVLWLVPPGALNPSPTGTIDIKDVKIRGVFRRKSLYWCC